MLIIYGISPFNEYLKKKKHTISLLEELQKYKKWVRWYQQDGVKYVSIVIIYSQ